MVLKEFLEKSDTLAVSDTIAATSPPQGFAFKYFNGVKLKLLFFFPPTALLSVDYLQSENHFMLLK